MYIKNRACIYRLKQYNNRCCHNIDAWLVTALIDFRGELVGQKALVIQVDMKWGLIDSMPPLNELTIVTFFKRYSHFNCKMNVSRV
jgi:hypothetical protein